MSSAVENKKNDELLNEFISEALELLAHSTELLSSHVERKLSAEDIDSLYRDIHTIKGSSQLFGFVHIGSLAHAIEACLEPVRQRRIELDEEYVDIVLRALDRIEQYIKEESDLSHPSDSSIEDFSRLLGLVVEVSTQKMNGDLVVVNMEVPNFEVGSVEDKINEAVLQKEESVKELVDKEVLLKEATQEMSTNTEKSIGNRMDEVVKKDGAAANAEPKAPSKAMEQEKQAMANSENNAEASTVRVSVSLLDKLMNLAGEMVLVRNQVIQHARQSEDNEYLNLTKKFDVVTTELQDEVMKTRMQPIGTVFSKFQRAVRDIGRSLDKKIDLVIMGADTELDKSIIEAIKVPLTHIVRNSCDHGIESQEERKAAGKPEKAVVSLNAFQEGGQVVIEIKDDGRGLDTKKIADKAIEKKLITPEMLSTMPESKINEMIFMPGFSTASAVTSVSGRGVGMDVVKTNIEKVGGAIEFLSVKGKGSTLRLHIPLTLAIVPAMIIRSDKEYFAIPQVKLQELIRIEQETSERVIEKIQDRAFFRLRGELLPLIELNKVLKQDLSKFEERNTYNIAVVKSDQKSYGLILDEVCDTADIVVKPLSGFGKKMNLFSGATILGDGNVSLILDIQGLAEYSGVLSQMKESAKEKEKEKEAEVSFEKVDYIVFSLGDKNRYCIPLILIYRLEEFQLEEAEVSAGETVVPYRSGLLPLINVSKSLNLEIKKEADAYNVLVVQKANGFYGLVVDEILDIVSLSSEVKLSMKKYPGILGTIVSDDSHTITALDALEIIRNLTDEVNTIEMGVVKKKKFPDKRVLLLEDSPFFVKQIKKVLSEMSLQVEHVMNGVAGLELLEKRGQNYFDLILSDIEMPQMNGYQFAKELRQMDKFKDMRLFAITTRFSEEDRKNGIESGFNMYLEKLKAEELSSVIIKEFEG